MALFESVQRLCRLTRGRETQHMNGTSSGTPIDNARGGSCLRKQAQTWPKMKTVEIRIAQGKDSRYLSEVISGLEIYSDYSLF